MKAYRAEAAEASLTHQKKRKEKKKKKRKKEKEKQKERIYRSTISIFSTAGAGPGAGPGAGLSSVAILFAALSLSTLLNCILFSRPNRPRHRGSGTTARPSTAWSISAFVIWKGGSAPGPAFKISETTMKMPPSSCPPLQQSVLVTSGLVGWLSSISSSRTTGTSEKLAAPRTERIT